jgi:hypothetical protein
MHVPLTVYLACHIGKVNVVTFVEDLASHKGDPGGDRL